MKSLNFFFGCIASIASAVAFHPGSVISSGLPNKCLVQLRPSPRFSIAPISVSRIRAESRNTICQLSRGQLNVLSAAGLAGLFLPTGPSLAVPAVAKPTIIVTGASSGIGRAIATSLLAQGFEVVLGCRTVEQALRTGSELEQEQPRSRIVSPPLPLDLSDLTTVRAWADAVRSAAADRALSGLVLCAGIDGAPNGRTPQGLETHFAVNHAGHFLLLAELRPALRRAAGAPGGGAAVVSITSSAALDANPAGLADPNWDRRPYDKRQAYCVSKACGVLLTDELARREAASAGAGVRAYAVDPGPAATAIVRYELPQRAQQRAGMTPAQLARQARTLGLRTPEQAARLPASLSAAAATGDPAAAATAAGGEPAVNGGLYLGAAVPADLPGPLWTAPLEWRTPASAAQLWALSAALTRPFASATAFFE
jgi:NAD(P)-dependent dehydrogenase (short-subunit alcohol dehydrogenase family)